MIPQKTFGDFGAFYNETISPYRSKYFVQVRDNRRTIQIYLRNFGWIEVTPLSFTQIYVDIVKNITNKQTHLFIVTSTKELIKLYQKLTEDPNAPLPKPMVYKEAPPSAPVRPRKVDKKAERKARKKAHQEQKEQEILQQHETKKKEEKQKFKQELREIEAQMKKEEKEKQQEHIAFYQPPTDSPSKTEESPMEELNKDEDLF